VYVSLQAAADMPQVLYWQTGLLTYLSPLVLATLYVGWLARCARRGTTATGWISRLAVCFVLAFLAGGTSETFAAAQATALALALVIACLAGAGPVRPMLLIGLLGATLAAAIVAIAPGNEVRQSSALRTPLLLALPQAVAFMRGWLRLTFARPHAIELLLLIGIPAAVAATSRDARSTSRCTRWYVVVYGVVGVLLVILACIVPAFYALGTNPPGRAQLIPEYVLVCSVAVLGWIIGTHTARHLARASGSAIARWSAVGALLVLLTFGPLLTAGQTMLQVTADRAYAAAWDQVDGEIRAERGQGIQDVTVPRLASTGNVQNLQFIGTDPSDWFNQCVARYYRVNTIAAET
jgi:uncharacterized membrane protein YeaQ/YmgE (transglycosylase-associated protein family)